MKKITALLLVLAMLVACAACGTKTETTLAETTAAVGSGTASDTITVSRSGSSTSGSGYGTSEVSVEALEEAAARKELGMSDIGGLILDDGASSLKAESTLAPDTMLLSTEEDIGLLPDGDVVLPPEEEPVSQPQPQSGLLTAGEWKDLDDLAFWTGLLTRDEWKNYEAYWKLYAEDFVTVHVAEGGVPVALKEVSLTEKGEAVFTGVTDIYGNVTLFWNTEKETDANGGAKNGSAPDGILVDGMCSSMEIRRGDVIALNLAEGGPSGGSLDKLDLMFMIDTTGSMGDEMEYLKKELASIVRSVQKENGNAVIRISVNFYKDDGDEYVVRDNDFTTNVKTCVDLLEDEYADGGGDFPEAVDRALETAAKADWDEDAVKLCFLVLDAPPHEDSKSVGKVKAAMMSLAEQGIRLIPVAASGIDKSSEYIFRCFSLFTGGTYVFLTDDSGIGGSHLEPTVGDYDVELLKDCIIRIICEYCGY